MRTWNVEMRAQMIENQEGRIINLPVMGDYGWLLDNLTESRNPTGCVGHQAFGYRFDVFRDRHLLCCLTFMNQYSESANAYQQRRKSWSDYLERQFAGAHPFNRNQTQNHGNHRTTAAGHRSNAKGKEIREESSLAVFDSLADTDHGDCGREGNQISNND